MQNIFDLIGDIRGKGISISLHAGRLKVEPGSLLDNDIRETIKANRDRIIQALEDLHKEEHGVSESKREEARVSESKQGLKSVSELPAPAICDNKADIILPVSQPETSGRTWTKGNPYTCACGDVTGWTVDGQPLCPVCYHVKWRPIAFIVGGMSTPERHNENKGA